MKKLTQSLIAELRKHADPARAEHDKSYHKSSRQSLGVKTALIDKTIRPYLKELQSGQLVELADELWKTDIFDAMISAARIISDKKVMPSHRMWLMIKSWMNEVDGWALEDNIARAAWKCIRVNPEILDELEKWTHHNNFWYRRAALIFTLPQAKKGMNPERMLKWAAQYASDPEWFIQKAIGWWLRELGQHNPERVVEFLNRHWTQLKTVARKEATRKLPAKWVQKINVS